MTCSEIAELGITNGFELHENEWNYILNLKRKDGIKVELSFPNDNTLSDLKEDVNIDWEYYLIEEASDTELYKDWLDIYGGTAEDKIHELNNQILDFIIKISKLEIRIEESYLFSFFGLKFLKHKELQFKTTEGWSN